MKEKKWAEELLSEIEVKMEKVVRRNPNSIPYTTDKNGHYDNRSTDKMIGWWTNGFWSGILWQLETLTGKELYREEAIESEAKLDANLMNANAISHDMGFMWLPTAVAHYKNDENAKSKNRAELAATLLAGRFNPNGNFLRAWNNWNPPNDHSGWAIIDCMMNLPLLYWASEELKDPRFKQIAIRHADMALEHILRPDGSAKHIVCFNPETGEYEKSLGGQGYAHGSSWTRGQAWGLYGFTLSYIHTGDEKYLDAAKRIANYFIANIPATGLIPIDFRQPKEDIWEDSSASAIAACGLLELARQTKDSQDRMLFEEKGTFLLKTLAEKRLIKDKNIDNLISHCSEAYHSEKGRHIAIIYADYYFIEGLMKLADKDFFIW